MFPFSRTILDFFFPPFCVGCGKDGAWLCQACLLSIPLLEASDTQIALSPYAHPTTRKLVTNLKYKSAICLRESLQAVLERYKREQPLPDWQAIMITSVPASEKRLRERGVDQATLIADLLKETWYPDAARSDLLKRIKHTLPNAKLEDERARQGNVGGAFAPLGQISGTVILVDDVYTSGATMKECARVLKEAGATDVKLFTIARG